MNEQEELDAIEALKKMGEPEKKRPKLYELEPTWFDISAVYRPADRISFEEWFAKTKW